MDSINLVPTKTSPVIFLVMFLGGALGAVSRYGIELIVQPLPQAPLILTSIVNLLGAMALGFVNGHSYFQNLNRKMFFGHGFLGSFTTMSGLAAISAGVELGLSQEGFWYWSFVVLQLIVGVVLYRFGLVFSRKNK